MCHLLIQMMSKNLIVWGFWILPDFDPKRQTLWVFGIKELHYCVYLAKIQALICIPYVDLMCRYAFNPRVPLLTY